MPALTVSAKEEHLVLNAILAVVVQMTDVSFKPQPLFLLVIVSFICLVFSIYKTKVLLLLQVLLVISDIAELVTYEVEFLGICVAFRLQKISGNGRIVQMITTSSGGLWF